MIKNPVEKNNYQEENKEKKISQRVHRPVLLLSEFRDIEYTLLRFRRFISGGPKLRHCSADESHSWERHLQGLRKNSTTLQIYIRGVIDYIFPQDDV